MADNDPNGAHNNPKKKSNPFKKIFNDVKKLIVKEEEDDKRPASFEVPTKEKNKESNQQSGISNITKIETPETKEAERSMRERKGKIKEQKLPKKFRKGW